MKYLLIFLMISYSWNAQTTQLKPLLEDDISIRAIEIWNGKVFYAGTNSKFGYVDIENSEDKKQIRLAEEKLQFRTLAQDRKYFYTISIENPAKFYKIRKKNLKHAKMFQDNSPHAFYDALKFVEPNIAYTFSDPDDDLSLKIMFLNSGNNKNWQRIEYLKSVLLKKGEGAFAASNSNIAASENFVWIATGGTASRIIRLNQNEKIAEVFDTPFVQGESSQGMYSIDFYDDEFGIAVGGDYTKQSENSNNIATTKDGGETWQIKASGANAGYSTCVKIRPGSKGKDILAVGDQHISYSEDFGRTWKILSAEKGFYVAEWFNKNTVILAGKNRITMMKLVF